MQYMQNVYDSHDSRMSCFTANGLVLSCSGFSSIYYNSAIVLAGIKKLLYYRTTKN